MKEQSHKDEMRAAVRGDFERLRARRSEGIAEATMPAPRPAEVDATAATEPEPVQVGPVQVEPVQVEPVHVEPVQVESVQVEPEPAPRPSSWLTRLGLRR